jgi:4-hydroxy-tetrahydrodipicolinate synthase
VFATQGCILVKAGLRLQGRGNGRLRSPMPPATDAETAALVDALEAAGLPAGPIET